MTAVEWLYEILTTENWEYKTYEEQNEIFQKAKQMEKEQIINAFKFGEYPPPFFYYNAEQYYDETFGSKGSDEVEFYKKELEDERNRVVSSQTEISDEEIEKAKEYHWSYRNGFVEGAKWYREKLKEK